MDKPFTSRRMAGLPMNFFATYDERLRVLKLSGADIVHLDVGSPDLPPPPAVVDTLARVAARPDAHGYQTHRWPQHYREAWAAEYRNIYNVTLDPDSQIVPLIGSKEGIFNLNLALVNPGDGILLPNPGYPTYLRGVQINDGTPHIFPLDPQNGFRPDLSAIEENIWRKAKLLWLNFPNNPTAAIADETFFSEVIELARRHNLIVVHDAAYARVGYDGNQPISILQTPGAADFAVEFNTLSKSHNMAGWRTAVMVGNATVVQALFALKTNIDSGHFLPVIEAATTALNTTKPTWVAERNLIYQHRRDILVDGLRSLGLDVIPPRASLYVWLPLPDGWDSSSFALSLLEQAHVSVTPGPVFGSGGEGYVRISLTSPENRIRLAIERIKEWWNHATPLPHRR